MIQMSMNVQSIHAATMEDALTLMETTFAYVNQDGRLKIVQMVIKKQIFLELSEKNPHKILIEAAFKCNSNDLSFNVMKRNCHFLL